MILKKNGDLTVKPRDDEIFFKLRHYFQRGALSSSTQEKLIKFHHKMALVYATYDFIVTPAGEEIFLECNPNGQWVWTNAALERELCQAMVEEFRGV